MNTWIIAADGNRARIFEETEDHHLREVEDLVNPEGRMAEQDINADAKGRYFMKGARSEGRSPGHTGEPHVAPVEHEVRMFSKQVGDYLDRASLEHRYDKLCLIATPKFLGLLRENLGEHARQAVQEEIAKDVSWFSDHAVEEYLRQRPH